MAVADEAPQQRWVQRLTAEPHARALGPEGLRLEVDVGEARSGSPAWAAGVSRQAAAIASSCSSRMAPRRWNGTPSASYSCSCQLTVGCTTSRPSLSRSSVASCLASSSGCRSGIDHRSQRDAQARGGRGDGGRQHERVGPGRGGILVARRGVVARVAHDAARARGRAEHDVLAEHDRVDAGRLGLDGDAHERAEVTR